MSALSELITMASISVSETTTAITSGKGRTALQCVGDANLTGKTAIVTGGNSGIGVETVRALSHAGCSVILCARNPTDGKIVADAITSSGEPGPIQVQQLDLADLNNVQSFTDRINASIPKIDYLILNAGVMACPLSRTAQGFETQIGVNHIGHFHLTNLLLPKLKAQGTPARVIAVSSEGHKMGKIDLEDMQWEQRKYTKWGAYGQSKLANILFAKELAARMEKENVPITAYSLHPGVIPTNLSRHMGIASFFLNTVGRPFMKSIPQGAATTVHAVVAKDLPNGAYLKDCGVVEPNALGQDMEMAGKLWKHTEEIIKAAMSGTTSS